MHVDTERGSYANSDIANHVAYYCMYCVDLFFSLICMLFNDCPLTSLYGRQGKRKEKIYHELSNEEGGDPV